MTDDERKPIFSWRDDDLAEALADALLVNDAEAAKVTLHRENGLDSILICLRLRLQTKEGEPSEQVLALTSSQAEAIAAALVRLRDLVDAAERRN